MRERRKSDSSAPATSGLVPAPPEGLKVVEDVKSGFRSRPSVNLVSFTTPDLRWDVVYFG